MGDLIQTTTENLANLRYADITARGTGIRQLVEQMSEDDYAAVFDRIAAIINAKDPGAKNKAVVALEQLIDTVAFDASGVIAKADLKLIGKRMTA